MSMYGLKEERERIQDINNYAKLHLRQQVSAWWHHYPLKTTFKDNSKGQRHPARKDILGVCQILPMPYLVINSSVAAGFVTH